jgi:hypothetical protein
MLWLLLTLGCNFELPTFMQTRGLTSPPPDITESVANVDEGPPPATVEVTGVEPLGSGRAELPTDEPSKDEQVDEILNALTEEVAKLDVEKSIEQDDDVVAFGVGTELDGVFGGTGLTREIGGIKVGLGTRGTQFGAGGIQSEGSGLGHLETTDVGSGGHGSGKVYGDWAKGSGGVTRAGQPIVVGPLDRSTIAAVINRNMNQIRHCFQQEMDTNPSLEGEIMIRFALAKDGSVNSVSTLSSTLDSPEVEGCVERNILRMQFPKPKGKGVVIVKYPFVFINP